MGSDTVLYTEEICILYRRILRCTRENTILYTDPNITTGQIQRTPYSTDLKGRVFYNILYRGILRCTQKILYCTQTRRSKLDRFKECPVIQS